MTKEFTASLAKEFFASPAFLKGKTVVIGGSSLFHGAPLFGLKIASCLNEMVFFASPEPRMAPVAAALKSLLGAFIWVPFSEVEDYIKKADSVLIGPGLMRFRREKERSKFSKRRWGDREGKKTKKITEKLLRKFPHKQWVIDAGSLQVLDKKFIPSGAILTPNDQEMAFLFGRCLCGLSQKEKEKTLKKWVQENEEIIITKEPEALVCSSQECFLIKGGNDGLEKGGTGDVLAGLIVALSAKKKP
ncbi:hypothetical protein J7L81_03635, partial [Candidatus Aerophobetes bacterium]|nr:hypothetical protein [Candidatus Aerophobetes bacterium]